MSVIQHRKDDYFGQTGKDCVACGDAVHPPFLQWDGETNIVFCGKCCLKIKDGLIADLLHISAVIEIRKLNPAYRNLSLTRNLNPQEFRNPISGLFWDDKPPPPWKS